MAKIDLKFLDYWEDDDFIQVKTVFECTNDGGSEELISIKTVSHNEGKEVEIYLDKSTAIKFAKTLRTEINKIQ